MPAEHFTPATEMSIQYQEGFSNVDSPHGRSEVDGRTSSEGQTEGSNRSERRHPTPPTPRPHTEGSVDDDSAHTLIVEALSQLTGWSVAELHGNIAALVKGRAAEERSFVQHPHTSCLERKEQGLVEDVPSDRETRRAMVEFMIAFLDIEYKCRAKGLPEIVVDLILLARAYGCILLILTTSGQSKSTSSSACFNSSTTENQ